MQSKTFYCKGSKKWQIYVGKIIVQGGDYDKVEVLAQLKTQPIVTRMGEGLDLSFFGVKPGI